MKEGFIWLVLLVVFELVKLKAGIEVLKYLNFLK